VDFAAADVQKTLTALERAGFRPHAPVHAREFADPARRAQWASDKGMLVFSLVPKDGVPMVDLFLEHPIPFEDLWRRATTMTVRGVPVRVASIDDLVALKRLAGRPEDDADVEALTEIRRLRDEGAAS
jgi:hypothetical protein